MTTAEESMELASSNNSDDEDLFSTGDGAPLDPSGIEEGGPPPSKRVRLDDSTSDANSKEALLAHAKKRLSKWAARLFDPDRPRGLVETPQVIPLNDEILSAFGKREKEFDQAKGRAVQVSTLIDSGDEDDGDGDAAQTPSKSKKGKGKSSKSSLVGKVKVGNLAYRTSGAKLQQACERFGPLVEVNLILDKDQPGGSTVLNSGRAYVTFEREESAQACVDGMNELDGRKLRLTLAKDKPRHSVGGGGSKGASKSALNRYWDKDISTVCFRCGGVGHIEPNCTNPAKPRPCPNCGLTDHQLRACHLNRICFICGTPGHVNRDCKYPRGMPKRMVCGSCFQSGHHRLQCRASVAHVDQQQAICMKCGQKGHFLCQDPKWYYGLQGLWCFNCGCEGHTGYDCRRPNPYQCNNDPQLTENELAQAQDYSVAETLEETQRQQQQRQRQQLQSQSQQRGRQMERGGRSGGNRGYTQSMPPQRGAGHSRSSNNQGDPRRQSGGGDGGRRTSGGGGDRRRGYR